MQKEVNIASRFCVPLDGATTPTPKNSLQSGQLCQSLRSRQPLRFPWFSTDIVGEGRFGQHGGLCIVFGCELSKIMVHSPPESRSRAQPSTWCTWCALKCQEMLTEAVKTMCVFVVVWSTPPTRLPKQYVTMSHLSQSVVLSRTHH